MVDSAPAAFPPAGVSMYDFYVDLVALEFVVQRLQIAFYTGIFVN
jgi:hypothetical protein